MKKLIIIMIISWAGFIFLLSNQSVKDSQDFSDKLTSKVIDIVDKFTSKDLQANKKNIIIKSRYYVRKSAHFCVFLVLGILTSIGFYQITKKPLLSVLLGFSFCVLYALFDESHQYYVRGRASDIKDSIIDSCGSFVGCFLTYIIFKIRKI